MTRYPAVRPSPTLDTTNGQVAFWFSETGFPGYRESLDGHTAADVAIVGGGLTGLWTAYYLKQARPELSITIVEREFAGFGASGRNGGWLSAELAGPLDRYAAMSSREATLSLVKAMHDGVDEVISVAGAEGIDADIVKSGRVSVARNAAQGARQRALVKKAGQWGEPDKYVQLDAAQLNQRVRIDGAVSGLFAPQCARVQPAKLVLGMARVVERMGVRIAERTTAVSAEPGLVRTDRGDVRAPVVLRCLEGFTASIEGARREWLPMNSSMIVTKPLDAGARAAVGWYNGELLGTTAHTYFYAQRTPDWRIALGGRGIPYRYGSRTDHNGQTQLRTIDTLRSLLVELFPALHDTGVDAAWCGVLGVPRDWCATVNFDPTSGFGTAGGYVGSGLTTTNVAGRTLADLVLGRDSELTRLPWSQRKVRRWELEPGRWLGVHAMYALYRLADARESRANADGTSPIARFADTLTGR